MATRRAGRFSVSITGSVDGVALDSLNSTLTVNLPGKLIPVGTKVSAPGHTEVKIKVGLKNIGPGPAIWPAPTQWSHPVAAYINFLSHTIGSTTGRQCFPWGPYPELWGWLDPFASSYKFACYGVTLQSGQTHWYELVMRIDPEHPRVAAGCRRQHKWNGREG